MVLEFNNFILFDNFIHKHYICITPVLPLPLTPSGSPPKFMIYYLFFVENTYNIYTQIQIYIYAHTHIHVHMYAYNPLSPFKFACMCPGLTTRDWTTYVGARAQRILILDFFIWLHGALRNSPWPHWRVNWCCHYAGLLQATILFRVHGCSVPVICRGHYLITTILDVLRCIFVSWTCSCRCIRWDWAHQVIYSLHFHKQRFSLACYLVS